MNMYTEWSASRLLLVGTQLVTFGLAATCRDPQIRKEW